MPLLNPLSLHTTQLELFWYDEQISSATGFYYRFGQDIALVTNWHVLSGRHPETGIPLDPNHKCPTKLKCHFSLYDDNSGTISFEPIELDIVRDGKSTWWQNAGYKDALGNLHQVDIGLIKLNDLIDNFQQIGPQICAYDATMIVSTDDQDNVTGFAHGHARVGAEVFIIGFPLGIASQGVLPIWKRGSIASEPLFGIGNGAPIFLVDATTRQGMSGSPVVYTGAELTDGTGAPFEGSNGKPWLLGVYAGRNGSSHFEQEMALGRVWQRKLLDDIFFQRIEGGSPPVVWQWDVDNTREE